MKNTVKWGDDEALAFWPRVFVMPWIRDRGELLFVARIGTQTPDGVRHDAVATIAAPPWKSAPGKGLAARAIHAAHLELEAQVARHLAGSEPNAART